LQNGQQIRAESKTELVEQVKTCLHSGEYSRAVDLLRGGAAEFPNDAEMSELEKLAHDGVKRSAEAQRLITESQELFAQQKPTEAIQLLRKAHELDKKNSLARAILANALVEHARSFVETDWLEAEKLTNQALALNPAHPTAKTVLNLILDQKTTSTVEDWVSQARKLQSSGDLFAALAWVAEGLAVHPNDSRLLQIQDAVQRDQDTRRRQARRNDMEDLRRMQSEIDAAKDTAAKEALAGRIQALVAKYWTDGEILSIANALLLRLGLIPKSSAAALHGKDPTVIFHVPRTSAPKPLPASTSQISPSQIAPKNIASSPVRTENAPPAAPVSRSHIETSKVPPIPVVASQALPSPVSTNNAPQEKVPNAAPEPPPPPQAAAIAVAEISTPETKFTFLSSQQEEPARSNLTTLILVAAAAAIAAVAATLFFARKHYAPPVANAPTVSAPTTAAPNVSASDASAPAVNPPTPTSSEPATSEPSPPALSHSSDTAGKVASDDRLTNDRPSNDRSSNDQPSNVQSSKDQPPAESGNNVGSLLVFAGQDNARVSLNGKLQRQLTQAGQLRIPNLELKDYAVQVSKSGFQDTAPQKIRIRKGEEARLVFNLQPQPQPQPRLASLTIQGGVPGTAVFVDQILVGTTQSDGTLSVSTISPGDHTVELRKEQFKLRQFKEHFVAGGAISLTAADTVLEAAPGELKITFTPADAKVAIVKGERLTIVSSGVPLNLAAGTYTLTARTADGFRTSSTLEVIAGQSKTLDLSLAPSGMSKWDDPGAWKQEKDAFIRKGGNFVLYGVVPASGTFAFSAMPVKGRLVQWVLNYTDPKNYVLFQMDENNFYRAVIRNGKKADEIIVPDKDDKKSFRALHIRVSSTEVVHQIRHGDSWTVLDRWTQPGTDLSLGKFGFYIPGDDEVAVSSFTHYADLNIR
jgi:tetratricopeptide (TPR) repeat protein